MNRFARGQATRVAHLRRGRSLRPWKHRSTRISQGCFCSQAKATKLGSISQKHVKPSGQVAAELRAAIQREALGELETAGSLEGADPSGALSCAARSETW